MHLLLIGLLTWISSGLIQRLLVGAGLALGSYAILSTVTDLAVDRLTDYLSGLGSGGGLAGQIIDAILYCGFGVFISIIVSAYITRFAFLQLQMFITRSSA